jgi:hypothetical protein
LSAKYRIRPKSIERVMFARVKRKAIMSMNDILALRRESSWTPVLPVECMANQKRSDIKRAMTKFKGNLTLMKKASKSELFSSS